MADLRSPAQPPVETKRKGWKVSYSLRAVVRSTDREGNARGQGEVELRNRTLVNEPRLGVDAMAVSTSTPGGWSRETSECQALGEAPLSIRRREDLES